MSASFWRQYQALPKKITRDCDSRWRLQRVRLPQRPSSRNELLFACELDVTWLREHCGPAEPTRRDIYLPTGRANPPGRRRARDSGLPPRRVCKHALQWGIRPLCTPGGAQGMP